MTSGSHNPKENSTVKLEILRNAWHRTFHWIHLRMSGHESTKHALDNLVKLHLQLADGGRHLCNRLVFCDQRLRNGWIFLSSCRFRWSRWRPQTLQTTKMTQTTLVPQYRSFSLSRSGAGIIIHHKTTYRTPDPLFELRPGPHNSTNFVEFNPAKPNPTQSNSAGGRIEHQTRMSLHHHPAAVTKLATPPLQGITLAEQHDLASTTHA